MARESAPVTVNVCTFAVKSAVVDSCSSNVGVTATSPVHET
jgi:hypothetical protein